MAKQPKQPKITNDDILTFAKSVERYMKQPNATPEGQKTKTDQLGELTKTASEQSVTDRDVVPRAVVVKEKQPKITNDDILTFAKSVERYMKQPNATPEGQKTKTDQLGELTKTASEQSVTDRDVVPRAVVVKEVGSNPEVDSERLDSLFKKTMGASFNPNSKMDRDKREALTKMLASDPTLLEKSDTQVALEFYRRAK